MTVSINFKTYWNVQRLCCLCHTIFFKCNSMQIFSGKNRRHNKIWRWLFRRLFRKIFSPRPWKTMSMFNGMLSKTRILLGYSVSHWFYQQGTSDRCIHAKYFLCLTGDHSVCKTGFVVKPVTSLKLWVQKLKIQFCFFHSNVNV